MLHLRCLSLKEYLASEDTRATGTMEHKGSVDAECLSSLRQTANSVPNMGQAVWAYLVGKADASTKADTADDKHGKVLGKGTQDGTNAEGSSS